MTSTNEAPSSIAIRRAVDGDLADILHLADALFQEDAAVRDPFASQAWFHAEGANAYGRYFTEPDRVCYLAVDSDLVGAYLCGAIRADDNWRPIRTAEIRSLFVIPPWRHQRIGERLVLSFVDWAREQRVERVSVAAFATNEGALRFYRRMGFAPHEIILEQPIPPSSEPSPMT